jgi:hypothetical protein
MPILGIVASSNYQRVAPDTGAMFPIGMVQVGSAGASTISFTSIPATYKHLQIRSLSLGSASGTDIRIRFNSDTGSNYRTHFIYGDGSTVAAGTSSTTYSTIALTSLTTSNPSAFVTDILDYTSTAKNKTVRSLMGNDSNGSGYSVLYSGLWYATPAAITQIDITPNSGSFNQFSQFALYGIKGV